MRRTLPLLALVATSFAATTAFAETSDTTRKYALIVANNASVDDGVEPLRYADDDGARFYELFDDMTDGAFLLTTLDDDSQRVFPHLASKTSAPTRENLRARVATLAAKIANDRDAGVRSEVYLVFTGHGNVDDGGEGYLSLTDHKLRRSDLQRDVIAALGADFTHLIIDACHAYFMVRARGGGGWKDDRSGETLDQAFSAYLSGRDSSTVAANATLGVILSTAGTAEVHEWSQFRGGVFSHQLRSGLLGAADANGDGEVTYRELEAYLVAANAAVTNPTARISVFVEPPAQDRTRSLTRLDDFSGTRLVIPRGVGGRYHIEDSRGLRYLDMNIDPAGAARIALLPNAAPYYLRTAHAQAEIPSDGAEVRSPQLAFAEHTEQPRGAVEAAFRTSLFATPFGPAFVQGYSAGRESAATTQTATQDVALAPAARNWRIEVGVDYGVGTAPLRQADGVQHHLSAAVLWSHNNGLSLGGYLGYGFTDATVGDFHRVSAGVEVHSAFNLGAWRLGPRFRLGHQGVFLKAREVSADPIGLRAELALTLFYDLHERFALGVVGGTSFDVITQTDAFSSNEELVLNPFLGVGARF